MDGSRVYLHAAIDNFSRRILGWRVEERLNPLSTLEILSAAGADHLSAAEPLGVSTARASKESSAEPAPDEAGMPTQVVMDSGVENLNATVDGVFASGQLQRVLAQLDVTF